MRAVAIICPLAATIQASAAGYTFTGFARDLDTGELLYVETHQVHEAGTAGEQRAVLYRRDENAEPFARKSLTYGVARARAPGGIAARADLRTHRLPGSAKLTQPAVDGSFC